jgi:SAM-dependent methyltransferase
VRCLGDRLLDIKPNDKVLEVGFGPGLGIELAAGLTSTGYVAGVDPSNEMIAQATARNEDAIKARRVDLRLGSAGSLPFEDNVSIRRWRLIPCKSGQTPLPDCGKCSVLQRKVAS